MPSRDAAIGVRLPQRLMRAAVVVEREPGGDADMRLAAFEVNVLMLERAPQALDEHVVRPAAAAVPSRCEYPLPPAWR